MQSLGVVTRRVTEIFQLPGVEPVWTLTNASLNIHHILSFFLSFFLLYVSNRAIGELRDAYISHAELQRRALATPG